MEKTIDRPAVDIAPQHARPGLALALALLSIPGSTLAWDLPGGGFWIGLPLAVAAIVLGFQARRSETGRGKALAAIVLAGAMVAMMAIWLIAESL